MKMLEYNKVYTIGKFMLNLTHFIRFTQIFVNLTQDEYVRK